jgi:hypothetical protein
MLIISRYPQAALETCKFLDKFSDKFEGNTLEENIRNNLHIESCYNRLLTYLEVKYQHPFCKM